MISDARGGHVSPGIYTEEKDVTYSVKSLGITSLGLVGETLYGPAFENIEIKDWTEFVEYFGGTSPEKFKGNGYPKYELPYVAKSYLEESRRLNVVKVLGLSGYHAGPAWVMTGTKDGITRPLVVLRSRIIYDGNVGEICEETKDVPTVLVKNITKTAYTPKRFTAICETSTGDTTSEPIDATGKFGIEVELWSGEKNKYMVSLNPSDSDYLYKVVTQDLPFYIESVFDASWDGTSATTLNDFSALGSTGSSAITVDSDPQTGDMVLSGLDEYDDFIEVYRPAQTPWLVSEAYATEDDGTTNVSLKKLFKILTISDGNAANYQVKVSVCNIDIERGTFDIWVRDFNDMDSNPVVLEKFVGCTMVEGTSSYVAYKIGTADGGYVSKSKYITLEMAEGVELSDSVPCGFLGYPVPTYGDNNDRIDMGYNKLFKTTIKARKQYFGFANNAVDVDALSYKGAKFYNNENGDADPDLLTNGFHLDSVFDHISTASTILVDGIGGFNFDCVSRYKVTADKFEPRIIKAQYMKDTIYKDPAVRKFTVCFYGGFDGWDIHRDQRTNIDDFKATKYNTSGSAVFMHTDSLLDKSLNLPINLPETAITSDYYAYLAGYKVFANPQDIDINVFATPGIDWYNQALLTADVIEMIEDPDDGRGGDALYVMNAPNGEFAEDIVDEFVEKEYNTSYACTYYPWIMYFDESNKRYLELPATKDVVRNMAATDNIAYPWFAPAGIDRGPVKCVKATFKTTLADEDALYENMINPIKSFAQDGVKVWGNKTAYLTDSPLNRINVRRLMIRVKKLVTEAAKHLIFEQYDDTLEKQFRGLVDPILANVKANRGISDYRIMTEVTPETRDQHILPARILIKPTPALEYISISFVVYPESVSFEEN